MTGKESRKEFILYLRPRLLVSKKKKLNGKDW